MKKLITLFLTAVLCFSLVACGSVTPPNSNGAQQETENSTNEQTAAIVVHIAINPEFKIHVDNYGNVFDVECLNEDAKAVNNNVSVAGKSCEDAIVLILQETVNQSFLKDGGKIDIIVSVAEEISNQMDTWHETVVNGVTQVLAKNKLVANITFGSEIMEPQKEENSGSHDLIQSENKNKDISNDSGTAETDANGNTILKSENGYITIDKNGNKVLEVYTADDGTVITQNYDENGKLALRRDEHADGSWEETSYNDGLLVKEIREFADGSTTVCTETDFYANGNRKSAYTYFHGSSSYSEVKYYENGILSYEYNFTDDSQYTERSYYADGNKKTEKALDADGTSWDLTYNPDGSYYGYTYYPDGSVWYNEWDANNVQNLAAQKRIK